MPETEISIETLAKPEYHRAHHGPHNALAILLEGIKNHPSELQHLVDDWDGNISAFLDKAIGDRKKYVDTKLINRSSYPYGGYIGNRELYYDDLTGVSEGERYSEKDEDYLLHLSRVRGFLTLWILEYNDPEDNTYIEIGSIKDDVCRSCAIGNHCTKITDRDLDSESAEFIADSFDNADIYYEMRETDVLNIDETTGFVRRGMAIKMKLSDFRKFLLVRAIHYNNLRSDILIRKSKEEERLIELGFDRESGFEIPKPTTSKNHVLIDYYKKLSELDTYKSISDELSLLDQRLITENFKFRVPRDEESLIYEMLSAA